MPDFYVFNFLPLVLVEGLVLKLLKWGSLWRSLADSFMMNCVTILGLMLAVAPVIYTAGPFGLMLFCTYSLMVEGIVLALLDRHKLPKVWSAALVANVVGCLVLGLEVLLHLGDLVVAK
jgi:hypothetical protein